MLIVISRLRGKALDLKLQIQQKCRLLIYSDLEEMKTQCTLSHLYLCTSLISVSSIGTLNCNILLLS